MIGWVLYDLANTIFSFVVVTRYFNDWIIDERGQPDVLVGLESAAVSVALVLTLPAIGARVDRRGRHKPVLVAFTVLCEEAARRVPPTLGDSRRWTRTGRASLCAPSHSTGSRGSCPG